MRLGFIKNNVQALGPGNRIAVWFAGCPRRCKGCVSPELQVSTPMQECDIIKRIRHENLCGITGLTVSGGEPFMQTEALLLLVEYFKDKGIDDILVFTGYTLAELRARNDAATTAALNAIAVLVDGEYEEDSDVGQRLAGSSNQVMHFLNDAYRAEYEEYCKQPRAVQTSLLNGVYYFVGLPPKGKAEQLRNSIRSKR